jgi:hypothetical protein
VVSQVLLQWAIPHELIRLELLLIMLISFMALSFDLPILSMVSSHLKPFQPLQPSPFQLIQLIFPSIFPYLLLFFARE